MNYSNSQRAGVILYPTALIFGAYFIEKQKTILSSFGLSDIDVKSIAMDIGKQLSGSPTIIDETATKEDEDDGEDTFNIID